MQTSKARLEKLYTKFFCSTQYDCGKHVLINLAKYKASRLPCKPMTHLQFRTKLCEALTQNWIGQCNANVVPTQQGSGFVFQICWTCEVLAQFAMMVQDPIYVVRHVVTYSCVSRKGILRLTMRI